MDDDACGSSRSYDLPYLNLSSQHRMASDLDFRSQRVTQLAKMVELAMRYATNNRTSAEIANQIPYYGWIYTYCNGAMHNRHYTHHCRSR